MLILGWLRPWSDIKFFNQFFSLTLSAKDHLGSNSLFRTRGRKTCLKMPSYNESE